MQDIIISFSFLTPHNTLQFETTPQTTASKMAYVCLNQHVSDTG